MGLLLPVLFCGGAVMMMMRTAMRVAAVLLMAGAAAAARAQYAVGADVSFLADAERQGVVFTDHGKPDDVLEMLHAHHYNWVRLRLFVNPAASEDKLPNDLPYTIALAQRAKRLGFRFLLDLHYSDTWADPGKQFTPAAWSALKHKQLVEQVFVYTREMVAAFAQAGVQPEMVQVGNEITHGMLWPDGKLPDNWDNLADLLKAGIAGVRAGATGAKPKIMIHIERSGSYDEAVSFFDNLIQRHVPFDVMGLSYYPFWHGDTVHLRATLHDLALKYRRPIVVVETAANWTPSGDGMKKEFAETPEGQRDFLAAVDAAVRAIPQGLGAGVFWWEPAVPPGPIAGRGLFDEQHRALPALGVFDGEK